MAVTMDMLEVIQMPLPPKGPVPAGLKPTALSSADSGPTQVSPVLAIGAFTFWPMSYDDNRMSFGMVMYDPHWNVVNVIEKKGARYIYKITLDASAGTVTFWGQADKTVQMAPADFAPALLVNAIS